MNLVYAGKKRVKRHGYLLIEMIVALAIVATMSMIIASMHSSIINWHKQATLHAAATNLALTTLSFLQNDKKTVPSVKGFTITHSSQKPDSAVPFILHTATVTFKTPWGIEKKVSITAGALDARG